MCQRLGGKTPRKSVRSVCACDAKLCVRKTMMFQSLVFRLYGEEFVKLFYILNASVNSFSGLGDAECVLMCQRRRVLMCVLVILVCSVVLLASAPPGVLRLTPPECNYFK